MFDAARSFRRNAAVEHKFMRVAKFVQAKRHSSRLSVSKAALWLRVPESTVIMLEDPENSDLSSANMQGLYRRYATFLGIDDVSINARLDAVPRSKSILPKRAVRRPSIGLIRPLVLTRLANGVLMVVVGAVVMGYLLTHASKIGRLPQFSVDGFEGGAVLSAADSYVIRGTVDYSSTLLVEGTAVGVDETNRFNHKVYLQPGLNLLDVTVLNNFAKSSSKQLRIIYSPRQQ